MPVSCYGVLKYLSRQQTATPLFQLSILCGQPLILFNRCLGTPYPVESSISLFDASPWPLGPQPLGNRPIFVHCDGDLNASFDTALKLSVNNTPSSLSTRRVMESRLRGRTIACAIHSFSRQSNIIDRGYIAAVVGWASSSM
jgi:hypothetical protein